MSADINLIIDRRDRQKTDSFSKIIRNLSLLFLILVLGASFAIFLLNVFSPISNLQAQEQNLRRQLSASSVKEAEYSLLLDRISQIQSVMKGRPNYNELLSQVRSQFSSSIIISSLNLEEKNTVISGQSDSLFAINDSLLKMEELSKKDKRFSQLVLSELTLDAEKGVYSFSLSSKIK